MTKPQLHSNKSRAVCVSASRYGLMLYCAILAIFCLSSCGSADAPTTPTDKPDSLKRGCNGCPNPLLGPGGRGVYIPGISADYVARRSNGDISFQYCRSTSASEPCKLATIQNNVLKVRDTIHVNRQYLGNEEFYFVEIVPVDWSPYGADTLLVWLLWTNRLNPSMQVSQYALGLFDLNTDSVHLIYDHKRQRILSLSNPRFLAWSEGSTPGSDSISFFSVDAYPGSTYNIQSSTYSNTTPEGTIVVTAPNRKNVFETKWFSGGMNSPSFAFLDGKPLHHLYVTPKLVSHWAWSDDSRYLALLWVRNETPRMPIVPNQDTLPSDRVPCQSYEVAVFDMNAPKFDSLDRLEPTIRWNTQDALCLYANFTNRISFTPAGTLLIPLADRQTDAINIYEVTIDGRLVRQVTNF